MPMPRCHHIWQVVREIPQVRIITVGLVQGLSAVANILLVLVLIIYMYDVPT